jgi:hypothetical protein
MPLIRDDDEERIARVEAWVAEVRRSRDVARKELAHARQTAERADKALEAAQRRLVSAKRRARKKR